MPVRPEEVDVLQSVIEFIPGQDPVVALQGTPVWSLAEICKSGIRIGDEGVFREPRELLKPEVDTANDQRRSKGAENRGLTQTAWHGDK